MTYLENLANKQTSNLNNDFKSLNLANSNAGKFARDYDKEPVITKDYKQNLSLFSAVLTLALVIVVILISLFFL
ncbi:hypothetical protein [Campylobacter rectus]